MGRGIIEPLNMTFTEAMKRIIKDGNKAVRTKKKRPDGKQAKNPPVTTGASPPSGS